MKIGTKISLGFVVMLVMIVALGANAYFSLTSTKDNIHSISEANGRLLLEMEIENIIKDVALNFKEFTAYGDEKYYVLAEESINKVLEKENQLLETVREERKAAVQELINKTIRYKQSLLNELAPVARVYHRELRTGNKEEADVYFEQMNAMAADNTSMANQISISINALVAENNAIVNTALQSSEIQADRIVNSSFNITLAAIVIGMLLSFFLTRMIRNPVLQMVTGANKMADGDFRADIEVKSRDEIGELAIALRQMKENFKHLMLGMQKSANHLTDSAQQLAAQAQQTSGGASETASTMNEMAATIDHMSNNAQDVARQADAASGHANKGYQSIELVNGQMQAIATATEQVNSSIGALNTAIGKIGQFVEVINNTAEQTNLLALNAAIEAARAGEAGRGFAVVADEVRELAEQSAQSTHEITQIIEEIQIQSEQAVKAISAGHEKVARGSDIVKDVGQSFSLIINAVHELSEQVHGFAASAQQVSAGIQNVAGTTEEQTAAMEEVSAAAEDLNQLAEELNVLVAKFKI